MFAFDEGVVRCRPGPRQSLTKNGDQTLVGAGQPTGAKTRTNELSFNVKLPRSMLGGSGVAVHRFGLADLLPPPSRSPLSIANDSHAHSGSVTVLD